MVVIDLLYFSDRFFSAIARSMLTCHFSLLQTHDVSLQGIQNIFQWLLRCSDTVDVPRDQFHRLYNVLLNTCNALAAKKNSAAHELKEEHSTFAFSPTFRTAISTKQ